MSIYAVQISDSAARAIRKLRSGSAEARCEWFLQQFVTLDLDRESFEAGCLDEDLYNDRLMRRVEEAVSAAITWGADNPALQELRRRYADANKLLADVE